MTPIDKIAWIRLEDGKILSTRSRGKDVYYIPGGKREPGETDSFKHSCIVSTGERGLARLAESLFHSTGVDGVYGRTGAYEGVIGFSKDRIIEKFLSQTPRSFETAKKDIRLSGCVIAVDEETGKATGIERVQVRVD